MSSFDRIIKLIISLIVAIFMLAALSPVYSALFNIVPAPASTAISTYSTLQDATDISAIVINIIGALAAVVGLRVTKDVRVSGVIIIVLFMLFLATGL